MTYYLGARSLAKLAGVHPDLVRVAKAAITIAVQDFGVGEGIRSAADQLRDWMRHTTKLNGIPVGQAVNGIKGTGIGNHQVKADGYSHAVDLVPYIDGMILWSCDLSDADQWKRIFLMAAAVQAAAIAEGVQLRWGGVWDRRLNNLPTGAGALAAAVAGYKVRHAGPDLLDGPHFELVM